MGSRFDDFAPMDFSRIEEYSSRVQAGYGRMRDAKAVLCGLARNVPQPMLVALHARIGVLRARFGELVGYFFENDSQDNTAGRLKSWQGGWSGLEVYSVARGDPLWPRTRNMARAEAMAGYREHCRQAIAERHPDAAYVIVVDLDLQDWDETGIANTLGQDDWDMVGSNGIATVRGRQVQFDAWAFRRAGDFAPMHWRQVNPMRFRRGEPMLACNSCFGGMGVYRMEAYLSARYTGGDCEHVGLHRGMTAAGFGRIYLNPSQVVLY